MEAAQRVSATVPPGQADQIPGGAGHDDQPAPARPASPQPSSGSRPIGDAEMLEVEAVQRRQLLDVLVHGAPGPGGPARAGTGRGLLIGIAVAVAIALGVGLVATVQATMSHGGSSKPGSGVVGVHAIA